MKKIVALLLCVIMLLTMAVGCKDKEEPEVLDETRIVSDLSDNYPKYIFSHASGRPSVGGLQIVERNEEGDDAVLSVTATAHFRNATVAIAADMDYQRVDGQWTLNEIAITKTTITPTAAPDLESVLMLLDNYISITGSALAAKGDDRHQLKLNVRGANWEMECEDGAKTAKLNVSMKSEQLTFTGYYTLTFKDTGWDIACEKQDNGQYHPLLHLETLEQKESKK